MKTATQWTLPIILLGGMVSLFVASRYLPGQQLPAIGLAVDAGYTDQTHYLTLLVYLFLCALGLVRFVRSETLAQLKDAEPKLSVVWFLALYGAGFGWFCVWWLRQDPGEGSYFVDRLHLMDQGLRPYLDFEFAYGPLLLYLPAGIHRLGLSDLSAYFISTAALFWAGGLCLFVLVNRLVPSRGLALLCFISLCLFQFFGARGTPAIALYSFGRFAIPFVLLGWAARLFEDDEAKSIVVGIAAFLATALVIGISPELGMAVGITLSLLALVFWRDAVGKSIAAVTGVLVALSASWLLTNGALFTTLMDFARRGALFPVVPTPFLLLYLFAIFWSVSLAFASALQRFLSPEKPATKIAVPLALATCSAGLVPVVLSTADSFHAVFNGFVPMLLAIGQLRSNERLRTLAAYAFLALVGVWAPISNLRYNDQLHRLIHDVAPALPRIVRDRLPCHTADCAPSTPLPDYVGELNPLQKVRVPIYDPLEVVPAFKAPTYVKYGYFTGVMNLFTVSDADRKIKELRDYPLYILPLKRGRSLPNSDLLDSGYVLEYQRFLNLYPFPLPVVDDRGSKVFKYLLMQLYGQCQSSTRMGDILVCRAPDSSAS